MTTTYDPADSAYLVEEDLRAELHRVYDLCQGCRLCFNLCPAFPSLFEMVDAHDGDVAALSTTEQDRVVDECYQCKLCYVKCPYVPPHEWELDFPRLMMRAHAVRHADVHRSLPERAADEVLGRTDLVGKLSTRVAPLANAVIGATGSPARKAMQVTVGIHAERLLPPYARQRFTTWFAKRAAPPIEAPRAEASVFPTCFVEYMEPAIGQDLVAVYERNGIACSLPAGTKCCGAPWLHGGDVKRFQRSARRNAAILANEVRAGRSVIVAQPTCAYVLKKDYPIYVPGPDADLVASHTFDPAEFLIAEHRGPGPAIDTDFAGSPPGNVTYHLACHLRAQTSAARGRELLELAGAKVTVIEKCSGIDGTWGYRSENYELARKVAAPLARAVAAAAPDTLCGDCHLANTAIVQETGKQPVHPIQAVARAYGIPEP